MAASRRRQRLGRRELLQDRLGADLMAAEYERLKVERDAELWSIVAAPAETIGGFRIREQADAPEGLHAAPRASEESPEPTIPGPSGRRYAVRQTASGTTYGVSPRAVLLSYGPHAIERSRPSWNLEGVVDRLTASLGVRAEALDNAKTVVPSSEWPKLDALLTRWFRFPGTWRAARERIERCIRYMNLGDEPERQAMKALNTMALRGTWRD